MLVYDDFKFFGLENTFITIEDNTVKHIINGECMEDLTYTIPENKVTTKQCLEDYIEISKIINKCGLFKNDGEKCSRVPLYYDHDGEYELFFETLQDVLQGGVDLRKLFIVYNA